MKFLIAMKNGMEVAVVRNADDNHSTRSTSGENQNVSLQVCADEVGLSTVLKEKCRKNGREINFVETAGILHELGLLYKRRSPDKLSLLQSAVLLVGAYKRNPESKEAVKKDLRQLCDDVMSLAKAKFRNVDLVTAADDFYLQVVNYRRAVQRKLDLVKSECGTDIDCKFTQFAMEAQQESTDGYLGIMKAIGEFCVNDVIGKPPCQFSHVGFGSLARNEATTHSDFESMILLEEGVQTRGDYQEVLEYFEWYSVIFQLILIMFGEMIISFAAIPSLNDPHSKENNWFYDSFAKCGICPDGFAPQASKNPIGDGKDFKLIKPVSCILQYLTEYPTDKKQYLGDLLTRTCHVLGDVDVYKCYVTQLRKNQEIQRQTLRLALWAQSKVEESLKNFSPQSSFIQFEHSNKFDVKRFIYRSVSMLMMVVGRVYGIEESSSYDIVTKLHQQGRISEYSARSLHLTVAVACFYRLQAYGKYGGQDDMLFSNNFDDTTVRGELLETIGEKLLVEFFCTVGCLQSVLYFSVHADLKLIDSLLPSMKTWIEPKVYLFLRRFNKAIEILKTTKVTSDFDHSVFRKQFGGPKEVLKAFQLSLLGACYFFQEKYCLSLKPFNEALTIFAENKPSHMAYCLNSIGQCHYQLKQFDKCHQAYVQVLALMSKYFLEKKTQLYCVTFLSIAMCLAQQGKHLAAVKFLVRNSDNFLVAHSPFNRDIAQYHSVLGFCLSKLGLHGKALPHFKAQLDVLLKLTDDEQRDLKVANAHSQLGECYLQLSENENGLKHFQQVVKIRESNDVKSLHDIVKCQLNVVHCLSFEGSRNKALAIINTLMDSYKHCWKKLTMRNRNLFYCLAAKCHFDMRNFSQSLNWNLKLLDQYVKLKRTNSDVEHISCLYNVANCQFKLDRYKTASKTYLEFLGLQLQVKDPTRGEMMQCINSIHCLQACFLKTGQFSQSLKWCKVELEYREIKLGHDQVRIAECHNHIGACYFSMGLHANAITSYRKEETSRTNAAINANFREHSECFHNLGYVSNISGNQLEAASWYRKEAELLREFCSTEADREKMALAFYESGRCLQICRLFHDALICFVEAMEVFDTLQDRDCVLLKIVNAKTRVGHCFFKLRMFEEGLDFFCDFDDIYRLDAESRKPALLWRLNLTARCYFMMRRYKEAFDTFKTLHDNL